MGFCEISGYHWACIRISDIKKFEIFTFCFHKFGKSIHGDGNVYIAIFRHLEGPTQINSILLMQKLFDVTVNTPHHFRNDVDGLAVRHLCWPAPSVLMATGDAACDLLGNVSFAPMPVVPAPNFVPSVISS